MTKTPIQHNNEIPANLGSWFCAALITFAIIGTLDWSLALSSATAAGPTGMMMGWIVFVSIWVLGGSIWAITSGFALWAATGRATASPLVEKLMATAKKWWSQRHDST